MVMSQYSNENVNVLKFETNTRNENHTSEMRIEWEKNVSCWLHENKISHMVWDENHTTQMRMEWEIHFSWGLCEKKNSHLKITWEFDENLTSHLRIISRKWDQVRVIWGCVRSREIIWDFSVRDTIYSLLSSQISISVSFRVKSRTPIVSYYFDLFSFWNICYMEFCQFSIYWF